MAQRKCQRECHASFSPQISLHTAEHLFWTEPSPTKVSVGDMTFRGGGKRLNNVMRDTPLQLGARCLCDPALHFCLSHILLSSLPLVTKPLPLLSLASYRHAPAKFEKDVDSNFWTITLILSASKLRAMKYSAAAPDRHTAKQIARNILLPS
ncbi:uncharacterized protein EDB91DRAFT_745031 [Suillus paluster]|uniref:uncharacterized protein n=1 Tax=Suillus paluster TaxID=48578 RepID=UPI001B85B4E5|nr:uncharacterized protein EDB91DRAFT_745031 [Suillus paluster]KAG1730866.1 hypothetical protein EDB91DRAFT_745031 [Suillus paluster]